LDDGLAHGIEIKTVRSTAGVAKDSTLTPAYFSDSISPDERVMAGLLKMDGQPAKRRLAGEEFEIKALPHSGVHFLNPIGALHMQMLVKKTFADQRIFDSMGRNQIITMAAV
jgi:hypothetical protein